MAKRASQGKEAHSIAHSVLQHPQVGNRLNIDNGKIKISKIFLYLYFCIYLFIKIAKALSL